MIERLSIGPSSVRGIDGAVRTLAADDFKTYRLPGAGEELVIKTKRGRESVCTLRPEAIKTVSDWAASYRRFWEESFDKLDVVINQMKKEEMKNGK